MQEKSSIISAKCIKSFIYKKVKTDYNLFSKHDETKGEKVMSCV